MRTIRGLTLLELMIAMTILAVGALAMASTFMSSVALDELTSQEQYASKAIADQVAQIGSQLKTPFVDSGTTHTNVDSVMAFYGPTRAFAVPELPLVPGDAAAGLVILHLNESTVPAALGGARSLNSGAGGDTDTDDDFSTANQSQVNLVPIEIRVRWQTKQGVQTMQRYLTVARTDA